MARPDSSHDVGPAAGAGSGYGHVGLPVAHGLQMKRRGLLTVWLWLPLVTLGVYGFVWYYRVNRELAALDLRRDYRPVLSLLALFPGVVLVVPPFVSVWRFGRRVRDAQRAAGTRPRCSPALLLALWILGLGPLYAQAQLNRVVDHYDRPPGEEVPLYALPDTRGRAGVMHTGHVREPTRTAGTPASVLPVQCWRAA